MCSASSWWRSCTQLAHKTTTARAASWNRSRTRFSRLRLIWADSVYERLGLPDWVRGLRPRRKLRLEVVSRQPGQKGFTVLPRRWVVERTFAWLGFHRRLSKDYEALPETSEAMIYVAMVRLMLARLA